MAGTGRALQLLIVEDELVISMFLEDMVRDAGWQVVGPAHDLERALELAKNSEFDCAVLDIILKDGHRSLAVATALRERGISFIFATGLSAVKYRAGFEDVPVLHKPFTYRQFVTTVRAQLMPGTWKTAAAP
jgi:DNA-binding response OmpR family regulator